MFLRNGWHVEMRERPDLMLERDGDIIYAEVKHFHRKLQDQLDEQAMNAETQDDLLMPIGDTVDLEGAPAWRQIADVAAKKISQYVENMSTSNNDRGYESPQRYGADQQAIGPRATDQEIQKWISRQHGFVPESVWLLQCK